MIVANDQLGEFFYNIHWIILIYKPKYYLRGKRETDRHHPRI